MRKCIFIIGAINWNASVYEAIYVYYDNRCHRYKYSDTEKCSTSEKRRSRLVFWFQLSDRTGNRWAIQLIFR